MLIISPTKMQETAPGTVQRPAQPHLNLSIHHFVGDVEHFSNFTYHWPEAFFNPHPNIARPLQQTSPETELILRNNGNGAIYRDSIPEPASPWQSPNCNSEMTHVLMLEGQVPIHHGVFHLSRQENGCYPNHCKAKVLYQPAHTDFINKAPWWRPEASHETHGLPGHDNFCPPTYWALDLLPTVGTGKIPPTPYL